MSNIGNIGGPHGNIPHKRIDVHDTQGRTTGQAGSGQPEEASKTQQPIQDQADIHKDAILLAKAREAFDNTSDIREDRIAEVKAKLESGFYNSPDVIEALAEGLARGLKNG